MNHSACETDRVTLTLFYNDCIVEGTCLLYPVGQSKAWLTVLLGFHAAGDSRLYSIAIDAALGEVGNAMEDTGTPCTGKAWDLLVTALRDREEVSLHVNGEPVSTLGDFLC